jgi:hypothetical protein
MKKFFFTVLLVLLAVGCVTSSMIAMPDGSVGYEIGCSGGFLSIADCMNEAAGLCRGPYRIVDSSQQTSYVAQWNQYGGYSVPRTSRSLMVVCGGKRQ